MNPEWHTSAPRDPVKPHFPILSIRACPKSYVECKTRSFASNGEAVATAPAARLRRAPHAGQNFAFCTPHGELAIRTIGGLPGDACAKAEQQLTAGDIEYAEVGASKSTVGESVLR